ncbi:unnamed protein product [Cylicocyclus nassatus]|uniref:Uncharacterized protein n=1 Tax=Cylicocyclus nassatus TaxID=53992 RepID=A0AA36DNN5_CYLNA|nr:unnamed protein product [Cylicocyclus nassatus]
MDDSWITSGNESWNALSYQQCVRNEPEVPRSAQRRNIEVNGKAGVNIYVASSRTTEAVTVSVMLERGVDSWLPLLYNAIRQHHADSLLYLFYLTLMVFPRRCYPTVSDNDSFPFLSTAVPNADVAKQLKEHRGTGVEDNGPVGLIRR